MKHLFGILCFSLFVLTGLTAQNDGGRISGNLEANGNFFIRDTLIRAANTPQYDRQFFGADAWLNLNYSNWGFDFGLRFDMFNNSNLLNPQGSFTGVGIGRWYIQKNIDKLNILGGYIYDQIGSGIIFRAYELRPLLIDNALFGVRLQYEVTPNLRIKAFSGLQKQQFDIYRSVISGANIEGYLAPEEGGAWSLTPGFGAVHRTLDDASMNNLVSTLNTYLVQDAFIPVYNTYAFSLYNTLFFKNLSWYVEGAYKTDDNLQDPFGRRATVTGDTVVGGLFFKSPGSVVYTSLSYSRKGLGITLEAKRTENFSFRTRPQEELNRGLMNFLPPMSRVNTYRLPARYLPATQELAELAFQGDIRYSPSKKWNFNLNMSYIDDLKGNLLYREVYAEAVFKKDRKWTLLGGVQVQRYNQEIYFFKPESPVIESTTPFLDFLYKIDKKKAIRFEAQYMRTGKDDKGFRHDYGDWIFGQVEFTIAPHWIFTVSDMYNAGPGKASPEDANQEKLSIHYPRFDIFYSTGSNRFSLSYVKQVEGVVCTGGVCRLEPAFSGVKLTVNSSF